VLGLPAAAVALLLSPAAIAQGVVDYPVESLRTGEEGTVGVKVQVSSTGIAENCVVTSSSGYPRLDLATCELVMTRAQFSPSKDESGHFVRGMFNTRVKWVIPRK